jgi:hypothetical protein
MLPLQHLYPPPPVIQSTGAPEARVRLANELLRGTRKARQSIRRPTADLVLCPAGRAACPTGLVGGGGAPLPRGNHQGVCREVLASPLQALFANRSASFSLALLEGAYSTLCNLQRAIVLIEHPVYCLTVRLRLGRWFQPYTEPSLTLRR